MDSDVMMQQQQQKKREKTTNNNRKNQLSKYNKAKSSHSPGPTAFSPAKSLV